MIQKVIHGLKNIWGGRFARKALTIVSILLTAGILGYLVYSERDVIIIIMQDFRPIVLIYSFIIYSAILLITSIIWAQIMNNLGHKGVFKKHFLTFCVSALGKRLPGTIWYVAWRANFYKEDGYQGRFIILASGIEMAIIVIAAAFVSLFFSIPLIQQFSYSLIGFIIVIIASLLLLHPRIKQWIINKYNIEISNFDYKDIITWFLAYVLVWLLVGILLFSFGNLFSEFDITSLGYFIGTTAMIGVLSRLFLFLPSHFGFGVVSLSLLLSGIMPSSLAVVIALSNRIIITFFEIIWAIIAVIITRVSDRNNPK